MIFFRFYFSFAGDLICFFPFLIPMAAAAAAAPMQTDKRQSGRNTKNLILSRTLLSLFHHSFWVDTSLLIVVREIWIIDSIFFITFPLSFILYFNLTPAFVFFKSTFSLLFPLFVFQCLNFCFSNYLNSQMKLRLSNRRKLCYSSKRKNKSISAELKPKKINSE